MELLSKTISGVWKPTQKFKLQISNEILNVWLEEGDIAVLNSDLHIYEPEDDEIVEPQQNNDVTIGVLIDAYGNNSGPAPLQNTCIPVDNFEGVTNMNESTTSHAVNYFMAVDAV